MQKIVDLRPNAFLFLLKTFQQAIFKRSHAAVNLIASGRRLGLRGGISLQCCARAARGANRAGCQSVAARAAARAKSAWLTAATARGAIWINVGCAHANSRIKNGLDVFVHLMPPQPQGQPV